MTYQQHLAEAMMAMGADDGAAASAAFAAALVEARRVDADGPREAEVQNYLAQFHTQAGRHKEAREALVVVVTIYEKFPDFIEGLRDYYLQLMALSLDLHDEAAAEIFRTKAKSLPSHEKP